MERPRARRRRCHSPGRPLERGFFIEDDGPGIPESERDSAFSPGYTTASGDHAGFGLAIVREIARSHGWEVTITESEAGGARFEFTGMTIEI
ncbi:sensor histidine kinase [Halovenus salina]|uniref:histidine kinase n=1 Tax=Halovenus salina TaxID=1510225 RepID=A0ABD5W0F1_9EURY